MSPGGRNTGSSASTTNRSGGTPPPRPAATPATAAAPGPVALAFLQQPQPADVAQVADGPVDPGLVGEVGRPARLGHHGRGQLHADEGPGAGGDVGEVRPVRRHRDHRGRRVVRPDGDQRQRLPGRPGSPPACAAGSVGDRPDRVARLAQRREQARVDARALHQAGRPRARGHVEQRRRGRVRHLGPDRPGQPVRRAGRGSAAGSARRPAPASRAAAASW